MKFPLSYKLPAKYNPFYTRKEPGSSPGTLVYTGSKKNDTEISRYVYNKSTVNVINDNLKPTEIKDSKEWINIVGLNDLNKLKEIGAKLEIDDLILEDILNVDQRPKIEFNKDSIFAVVRMYYYDNSNELHSEQVSIVLKKDKVITFQEELGDIFNPIRQRLNKPGALIKTRSVDYLFYAIIDLIIDHYLIVIDRVSERIDSIDDQLNSGKKYDKEIVMDIYSLRQLISILRRKIFPVREIVNNLQRTENKLIEKDTLKYVRDLYDHSIIANENLDNQREILSDLLALYHTHVNNKMNETMKVLTVIATIFIPLSFIVGIYGMNFEYMPELSWKYGYFGVWGIIIFVFASMLLYFKRRKWL